MIPTTSITFGGFDPGPPFYFCAEVHLGRPTGGWWLWFAAPVECVSGGVCGRRGGRRRRKEGGRRVVVVVVVVVVACGWGGGCDSEQVRVPGA